MTHTVSGGDYGAVTADSVDVTVTDDDTPGITFSPTSRTITEGNMSTYTVKLNTMPTAEVTVEISSPSSPDVTTSGFPLTFTPANWDSAQMVTVTAVDDKIDEDAETVSLTHSASGGEYNLVTGSFDVTVTDNDTRGVTVTPTSLTVTEGGMSTYTVVLDTEPTDTVTVTVNDPADNEDVKQDPVSLTFTTTDWDDAQTVTVSAEEDDNSTDETATVTHTVNGGDYESFSASSVTVTVTDNDTPGVTVTPLVSDDRRGQHGHLHRGAEHGAIRRRDGRHHLEQHGRDRVPVPTDVHND